MATLLTRLLTVFFFLFMPLGFTAVFDVPLEAYGKLPSKSKMAISPSTDKLAYRDTSTGTDYVVILDLNQGKMIDRINVTQVKPNYLYFLNENTLILVVTDTGKSAAFTNEFTHSVAYAYNLNNKALHQLLIPGEGVFIGQRNLGRIIGTTEDKKSALMPAYEDFKVHNMPIQQDTSPYNLYRVSLEKYKKPRVYRRGTIDTIDYFIDSQGQVLARERFNNRKNLHLIEADVDGDWVEIFRDETDMRNYDFVGVTPDMKSLVFLAQDEEHGRQAYFTMNLTDGKISDPLFSHKDKDVEYVLKDNQGIVHGVRYSGFTPSYDFFDKKLSGRLKGIAKAMPNNHFYITDYTPDWKTMVFYMDGEQSSGDYVMYKKGGLSILSAARPDVPPTAVHPVKAYNYTAEDGLTIPSLITLPQGIEAKNLPAIMYPHGGPAAYDSMGFDWFTQHFANQGYVVIQPQFRGSEGFGPEHLLAGYGEWGQKMQSDLTDAVTDLANKGIIDRNKVCIVGSSYGGYAAFAGATLTPDVYKCSVAINGVSDVEMFLDKKRHNYGSRHWVVAYWNNITSKNAASKDHIKQISPINHVDKVKIPMLVIHGEKDRVVPVEQSIDMVDALEDADKDVIYIELEGGDHHWSDAENRMHALKEIDKFIKQHI